jgi:predicted acylesterase/phospholipase RssA
MKYGLVISGGGANGMFSLEILKNLINDGLNLEDVKYISGVSVGSIIGAMLVQDDFEIIYQVFPLLKNKNIYNGKFNLFHGLWNRLKGNNYVLDINPLDKFLRNYISLDKAKKSDKLFSIGITDFESGTYKYFTQHEFDNNDDYIKAILASSSQPIIWKNISFKTISETINYGYDGGVIHVSPMKEIIKHSPEKVIIINNSPSEILKNDNLNKTEDVLIRMIDIMLNANFKKDIKCFEEINKRIKLYGEYEDKKYFPYEIYQTNLHVDTLDFESKELVLKRYRNAQEIYNNVNK